MSITNSHNKDIIFFAGNLFSFVFVVNYLRNFAFAWINGYYTGVYRNTIDINYFGEANIELVLFMGAGAISLATSFIAIKAIASRREKRKIDWKKKVNKWNKETA